MNSPSCRVSASPIRIANGGKKTDAAACIQSIADDRLRRPGTALWSKRRSQMPKVKVNAITMNYEQQGTGEPLLLIPYLAADNACYAFQVAEYAKHFTCISVDPRGAGGTRNPPGSYSTELFADDIAAFLQAIGIGRAHVAGLSLRAATGLWLPP